MNKRPARNEGEDDILEMQKRFLDEKFKNKDFKPAAQVVKVEKPRRQQSLFARKKQFENVSQLQENSENTKEKSNVIIGEIIEKDIIPPLSFDCTESTISSKVNSGFPKVERLSEKVEPGTKSLFAQSMHNKKKKLSHNNSPSMSMMESDPTDAFGETSTIIEDEKTAKTLHEENLKLISQMTKEEILLERSKLLNSLDPKIIKFLEQKRKERRNEEISSSNLSIKEENEMPNESSNVNRVRASEEDLDIPMGTAEILNKSGTENWISFNVIEKEKLEWMKSVPSKVANLKPGEKFEARFDWKGILLPYKDEKIGEDNRELYLHGDEPYRPGYTLQELFRLARSNVTQQRVSAFSAIAGIFNIYNQGLYDNILELPISKLFFLLRFGFDENTPAILEIVSKAFSFLFYNEVDETLLDFIVETSEGYLQPLLNIENIENFKESDSLDSLDQDIGKLTLNSSAIKIDIQENEKEMSKTSMNDFQLAEIDLIDCLLRTNIIQRINYILGTIRPENSTVTSCLKILIRIARTNKDCAQQIILKDDLLNTIIESFLPYLHEIGNKKENNFYGFPQFLSLKLIRILMSQHIPFCHKFLNLNLMERLKSYLFTREDMKSKMVKVQIESFRIVRILMLLKPDLELYRYLVPAFRYMLEWHCHNVVFERGGSYLIRQHAAALLNAISSGPPSEGRHLLEESLVMCSCKWFHEANHHGIEEFSQSILLSAVLNCVSWHVQIGIGRFSEFIQKYLKTFIRSKGFLEYQKNISLSSILLKEAVDRRDIHPPLPNLGAVLIENGNPKIMIPQTYPVYFLNSLFKLAKVLVERNCDELLRELMHPEIVDSMTKYTESLTKRCNRKTATNFLAKSEINFVFKLLCFESMQAVLRKDTRLQATFNILNCMTSEHVREIETLFNNIMFNEENLDFGQRDELNAWRDIYLQTFVYPHRIIIAPTDLSLSIPGSKNSIFPRDWPYVLLKSLLSKYLQQMSNTDVVIKDSDFPEHEIIRITLSFTAILERNKLEITSPTEKLMYLMIAFMGPDSQFLNPNMKELLLNSIKEFYSHYENYNFRFDNNFEGKSRFENLYILFLDHFQGASYGDDLFSSLVMIPLAQKYDSKWRKIVWSEHASVLRFINCPETLLLGKLNGYLEPAENDVSLIKSYARALNSNLLRPDTIPYKIATHHFEAYKKKMTENTQKNSHLRDEMMDVE